MGDTQGLLNVLAVGMLLSTAGALFSKIKDIRLQRRSNDAGRKG